MTTGRGRPGRSRPAVREALERAEVPLGLGKAVTAALGLLAAILSLFGLEDLGECLQIGLEGVLGVLLGHDGPSYGGLVWLGAIERRRTGVRVAERIGYERQARIRRMRPTRRSEP